MSLAPVALFAFRRADHLARVVAGLQANPEAGETALIVHCDGARNAADAEAVAAVGNYARNIKGFASVEIIERTENFGLARSIIEGVGAICTRHGQAIVLEDDVVPTPFFLAYVNAALDRYANDSRVMSIGCYTFDTPEALPETFFLDLPDCWGWAVWQRSWAAFEPAGAKLHAALKSRGLLRAFDFDGAYPYAAMLADQAAGRNASWAVRWYASMVLAGGLTLYPGQSVTDNIGQDGTGTHGKGRPLMARLAMAPVTVGEIPVECSQTARQAWADTLRRQQGAPGSRALYALRSNAVRALRAVETGSANRTLPNMKLPGLELARKPWALMIDLKDRLDAVQQALGRIEARQTEAVSPGDLAGAEFKVSSQWGEDGIIAHLLLHVPVPNPVFVEFGVQDYTESNTRFVLREKNWSGLVLDGSPENIALIRSDPIYWRYNLKAEAAFITRENIDALISAHGIAGDIGLLSVDIDGNDYWVFEAITAVSARIFVAEYNALYGPQAAVSIPYDPAFQRSKAHHSNLYWGCSLSAWAHVAAKRGYALVGCNSNGNNAFFVRRDCLGALPELTVAEAFRPARFRESRDSSGALSYLSGDAARAEIAALPLTDVLTGRVLTVGDLARVAPTR